MIQLWTRQLFQDVRLAGRSLLKTSTFTVAALVALSLAIGANTAVFSVIHALQSFPVPVASSERIAYLFQENEEQNVQQGGISIDDFLDYREELSGFASLELAAPRPFSVGGVGEPTRIQGVQVTPGFFSTLRIRPMLGRGLSSAPGPAAGKEAVISHEFWRQSFVGGDVIGEQLRLDGETHIVVGVAPEGFFFVNPQTAVWTALEPRRGLIPRDRRNQVAFGRLVEGIHPDQANAEASAVAERLAVEYPETNRGWQPRVLTVRENLSQGSRLVRVLFYSAITFVLLIACVNVANLLLARSLTRERETALRASLGASRSRLFQQHFVESMILALSAGVLGVGLGFVGIEVLRGWIAPDSTIGFIAEWIDLDVWVALHALGISVVSGVFFGTTPALQALSIADLGPMLKEGGRTGDSPSNQRLRDGLVIGEVALALALLITAATLVRAFQTIYDADPGFDTAGILTLQVVLPEHEYSEPENRASFFEQVRRRLRAEPGVEAVATTSVLPLTRFPGPGNAYAEVEGRARAAPERAPNVSQIIVSEGYVETIGLELRRGRAFDARDRAGGRQVALVDETFVGRLLEGQQAIGARVRLTTPAEDEPGPWRQVIGVVARHDSHGHSLRRLSRPALVFIPEQQDPQSAVTILVRAQVSPSELVPSAREAIWQVDPKLPIDPVESFEQAVARVDTQNTFFLRILSSLALVAFILAAVGIYSIVAYSVSRRTREIGIRAALGARPWVTVREVTGHAARLTGAGLILGCGIAWLLVRFMASQLEGIDKTGAGSLETYLGVAAIFIAVAVVSSAWPSWQAARIDPVDALRED